MDRPDIDPALWQRARRIWVTELGSCPRKRQYRLDGVEGLSPHFVSARGIVVHRAIEQILKGEEVDPDYDIMPEAKVEISLEVNKRLEHLNEWLDTTEIDLTDARIEDKIVTPLKDGYLLVGTIDVLTPTHIIDFKSGKHRNSKPYRHQLAAYSKMMSFEDDNERELMDVFLGDEEGPVELSPFESSRTPFDVASREVEMLINNRIEINERLLNGDIVETDSGWMCQYCKYIGNPCRGI